VLQLQLQLIDGDHWPILTCTYCSQPVQGTGNVLWTIDPQTRVPIAGPFLTHAHCHDSFAQQVTQLWPTATWSRDALSTFMAKLIAFSQVELGA
jgi:hypothetical protein